MENQGATRRDIRGSKRQLCQWHMLSVLGQMKPTCEKLGEIVGLAIRNLEGSRAAKGPW